ncbi:hypothetical protein L6164_005351 [Bauhinia variegata]|uniref:Uncharacterized protein n=1 Tax=Bauhinia variegata TaxID=167791 RepID=A0ACB9PSG8_BAUVA|nr:hypothetical protein L6164_005351 [Bauhinia variegata]
MMSLRAFMSMCACRNGIGDELSIPVDSEMRSSHGFRKKIFEYIELEEATNNFHPSRNLGSGSYGTVYHGILQDGCQVAIKHLDKSSFKSFRLNDEKVERKFMRGFIDEVAVLTRLRHGNLVQIYGSTSPDDYELVLVQEYIPNGSVADHLRGTLKKPGTLPLVTRLNIAVQTASALAYLHSSGVIHCDVKTRNILLEDSFTAKVTDFGLSCLGVKRISVTPVGTPGYIDPEYYELFNLSDKSDVYSFGVVLIELISSMPAFKDYDEKQPLLAKFAINKILHEQLDDLVDPALGFNSDQWVRQTVTAVAELAFRCLYRKRKMRPSMAEVLDTLKSIKAGALQVLPGSDYRLAFQR